MFNTEIISFNKTGYDPFIDFLKAYAIVFVVVAHNFPASLWNYCLFRVWADMQVPLFILIQVFHAYKKGKAPKIKWPSLLKRIVLPFFCIQGLIVAFKSILGGGDFWTYLKIGLLEGGGYGPGSYYFWIYIQMALILVIVWPLFLKLGRRKLIWLCLLFSVGCEILFSLIDLPDTIYELLAVRYLFLIPLAIPWINEGVVLNRENVVLSIISIGAVVFFSFTKVDLEPIFFNTGWATHRWICYFYLPVLLTYALWLGFKIIRRSSVLFALVKTVANSSYEIYLIQMFVFVFLPYSTFDFISNTFVRLSIWMVLTFALSLLGGIILNRVRNIITVKK